MEPRGRPFLFQWQVQEAFLLEVHILVGDRNDIMSAFKKKQKQKSVNLLITLKVVSVRAYL